MKKIAAWSILAVVILLAGYSVHQANSATMGALQLPQFSNIFPGGTVRICATTTSPRINLSQLRWTTRINRQSLSANEMPANCRQYTAPAAIGMQDWVKVTYKGAKAVSRIWIVASPPRP